MRKTAIEPKANSMGVENLMAPPIIVAIRAMVITPNGIEIISVVML